MLDIAHASPSVTRRERPRLTSARTACFAFGFASLAVAATFMCYLMFVASGQVDPIRSTMSNYVFVGGIGWLFPAAVTATALAGLTALLGMLGTGLLVSRLLRAAMGVATVATLLVALFHTNRMPPMTVSAEIHRYAAGVAFCCVPLAALLVAARLPRTSEWRRCRGWLRAMGCVAAVVLTVFLASHLGIAPEPMQELRGLFQRLLFVVQLTVLSLLLLAGQRHTMLRTAARAAGRSTSAANSGAWTANSRIWLANGVPVAANVDSRPGRGCAMHEVRPEGRVA